MIAQQEENVNIFIFKVKDGKMQRGKAKCKIDGEPRVRRMHVVYLSPVGVGATMTLNIGYRRSLDRSRG